jgi:PilZ domain
MSARKIDGAGSLHQQVTVETRQTRLSLSHDSILFHKNGIEFRSPTSFSLWTEMTLAMQTPGSGGKINCSGVVISCTGSKHTGYHVSMVFTSLSRQAQSRLNSMAQSLFV